MADGLGSRGLSDQQRRFADFILKGKTQIEAHRLAGYKGKNDGARAASASEILRNPNVAAYLDGKRAKIAEKLELTTEHFARRLERIASAAERAAFMAPPDDDFPLLPGEQDILAVTPKEAADIARTHTMDAAKLLGLVIEKKETTVILHEDRLERARQRLADRNGRHSDAPTTH